MKNVERIIRLFVRASAFVGLALAFSGCASGTVYVGVAAPGPWVGYPPGGVYGGYPGVYGRPWYSPEEESPQEAEPSPENEERETPSEPGNVS
jgi:hypothetical protein